MRIISEKLTADDNRRILDLEGDIIDLKRRMMDTNDYGKEALKKDIDDIKKEIQDIKDRGKEGNEG